MAEKRQRRPSRITLRGRTVGYCIAIGDRRVVDFDDRACLHATPSEIGRLDEWKARADAWAKETRR